MSVKELTAENFDAEALQATGLVLVDFWASWCGPCKMLSPVVDEISEQGIPELKVCKVNIDEQMQLANTYRVRSIPTLILLKGGQKVASSVGVVPKEHILDMIEKAR